MLPLLNRKGIVYRRRRRFVVTSGTMGTGNAIVNPDVAAVFETYPAKMRVRLLEIRRLVLQVAAESEGIGTVSESLKWGEPAYTTKRGSTIRIDWKRKRPEEYAMYFICTTRLVETFRELYLDTLRFEGNRAIIFRGDEDLPVTELKHCIQLALSYHDVKHLPLLGA